MDTKSIKIKSSTGELMTIKLDSNYNITVVTSFGEIPYYAIREFLSKEIRQVIGNILKEIKENPITIEEVYKSLANRLEYSEEELMILLSILDDVYPTLTFNLLLREIAIMLDNKYPDHIENSKEIWTISPFDGLVTMVGKSCIKNFRNFAAFRSKEDAMVAKKLLSSRLRKMFRGSEK